jgi:hypothetical protein
MSDAGQQYQSQSEELKKLSTHYNNLSASLKEMNDNYRIVSEKLEQIQVTLALSRQKQTSTQGQ